MKKLILSSAHWTPYLIQLNSIRTCTQGSRPWHKLGLSSLANAKALVADGTGPFHHAGACMWLLRSLKSRIIWISCKVHTLLCPSCSLLPVPPVRCHMKSQLRLTSTDIKTVLFFLGDLVMFTHFCFLYAVCSSKGVTFSSWSWKILSLDQRKQWAVQHCHMGLMKCTSWHLTGQRLSQSLITC